MMLLLYNLLAYLSAPFIFLYSLVRMIFTRRFRSGLFQRFGFYPGKLKRKLKENGEILWVHAVSVGELQAARPILDSFKIRYPQYKVLVSTTTEAGHALAKDEVPNADFIIYFPLDFYGVIRRVFKQIDPSLILLMETEIWPNFISRASKLNIPVIMVNGRISDHSYRRYKLVHCCMKRFLGHIQHFCMQSDLDAQRIVKLGADPRKVTTTGNLKYERAVSEARERLKHGDQMRKELRIPADRLIMILGSTHYNEEEIGIKVFQKLRRKFPQLLLIIAPRRLERVDEVARYLSEQKIPFLKRRQLEGNPEDWKISKDLEVIILDTIGELSTLYTIGDIIFIGGSLIPHGGHNIFEPAALCKPVIFGPFMNNFKEGRDLLLNAGCGLQVKDHKEFYEVALDLLSDEQKRKKLGKCAEEVIVGNLGALSKNLAIIDSLIEQKNHQA